MSTPLITHAGKHGDLLWALPTIREIAALHGGQVDMALSPYCRGLVGLLEKQPYIRSAWVKEDWQVEFSAPVSPPIPPPISTKLYPIQFHLSMREWPNPTIPLSYPKLLEREYNLRVEPSWHPWLTFGGEKREEVVLSFSDEYVEAKVGTILALRAAYPTTLFRLVSRPMSRLCREFGLERHVEVELCDLLGVAKRVETARLAITCNSAPHVMGAATGTPTIVYEPNPMRHQPCFKGPTTNVTYVDSINAFELVGAVRGVLG